MAAMELSRESLDLYCCRVISWSDIWPKRILCCQSNRMTRNACKTGFSKRKIG